MPLPGSKTIVAAGPALLMLLAFASAQSEMAPSLRFALMFREMCYDKFPNISETRSLANSPEFTEVTHELLRKALAPSSSDARWKGWQFERERITYVVGVSEGKFDGVRGQTCNLARYRNGGLEIKDRLSELLTAEKQIEFEDSGVLITIFELRKNADPLLLTIHDYAPSKLELVNVTLTNDPRVN